MADRYDEAVRALREAPAPDQWNDIQHRAATPDSADAQVVSLDAARARRRFGWPVWTAAAAALVLAAVGAVALTSRDATTVTDTGPAGQHDATATTTKPPDSRNSTAATTEDEPEPEASDVPDGEAAPPATAPEGEDSSTQPSGGEVANCLDLELATTNAPADMDRAQQQPTPEDPRLYVEAARPYLIGVFDSAETTERAVFVVARGDLAEGSGEWVDVPDLGVEARVVHTEYPEGDRGVVEITAPLGEITICTTTLFSNGLTKDELIGFVQGLSIAH